MEYGAGVSELLCSWTGRMCFFFVGVIVLFDWIVLFLSEVLLVPNGSGVFFFFFRNYW